MTVLPSAFRSYKLGFSKVPFESFNLRKDLYLFKDLYSIYYQTIWTCLLYYDDFM